MLRNPLRFRRLLVFGALVMVCPLVVADDGKGEKSKPIAAGTWEKKDAEPMLEFTGEDKLRIFPHGANLAFQIDCSYTVTKEGLIKAKIARLEGSDEVIEKVKGSVPIGLEFRFKWTVDGDKAKLDDLDGEDVDQVKERLQGEYTRK